MYNMETPLTCDECNREISVEDGSIADVVESGTSLTDNKGFFIAVTDADVEDGRLRIIDADVYCAKHCPNEAYEP